MKQRTIKRANNRSNERHPPRKESILRKPRAAVLPTPRVFVRANQNTTSHKTPAGRAGRDSATKPRPARSDASKPRPRAHAGTIPVFCLFDEILPARDLQLWSEQPGSRNPQIHPPAQLDRYETVVEGNGYRRCAVRSTLSGCITKGNGLVQMARRRGWSVPVENQHYASRAEELRDVAADNQLAKLARTDDEALRALLGELDAGDIKFAAVSEDELAKLISELVSTEAEFPITAKLGESYDYVLISTTNATEFAFLQNLLGVTPERSYKKTGIGIGRVIPLARAIAALRANRHSIDVACSDDDHAEAAKKLPRVRSGKPKLRVRPGHRR